MTGLPTQLLLVMLGGALGAAGRFWLGGEALRRLGDSLPWGTLMVNLIGSFAVGFLAQYLQGQGQAATYWRAFLIVGVLGALTTWSSLALELVLLQRDARSAAALGYLLLTLVGGLGLVWLGAMLATLCSPAAGAAP